MTWTDEDVKFVVDRMEQVSKDALLLIERVKAQQIKLWEQAATIARLQAEHREVLEWAQQAYTALGNLGYLSLEDSLTVVELRQSAPAPVQEAGQHDA